MIYLNAGLSATYVFWTVEVEGTQKRMGQPFTLLLHLLPDAEKWQLLSNLISSVTDEQKLRWINNGKKH